MGEEHGAPARRPDPWALRIVCAVLQIGSLGMIAVAVRQSARYMVLYMQRELLTLPASTELLLQLTDAVRQPGAYVAIGVVGGALVVLTAWGFLDQFLIPMIVVCSAFISILVLGCAFALPLPLRG